MHHPKRQGKINRLGYPDLIGLAEVKMNAIEQASTQRPPAQTFQHLGLQIYGPHLPIRTHQFSQG
jgi:hypothetical protein